MPQSQDGGHDVILRRKCFHLVNAHIICPAPRKHGPPIPLYTTFVVFLNTISVNISLTLLLLANRLLCCCANRSRHSPLQPPTVCVDFLAEMHIVDSSFYTLPIAAACGDEPPGARKSNVSATQCGPPALKFQVCGHRREAFAFQLLHTLLSKRNSSLE